MPRTSIDYSKMPVNRPGEPNPTILVDDMVKAAYKDADLNSTLGMMILMADGGALGEWQYALPDHQEFVSVSIKFLVVGSFRCQIQ